MSEYSTPFFIPSYLGNSDGPQNFRSFADSLMFIGPLRFVDVVGRDYTVQKSDVDKIIRFTGEGRLFVPQDFIFDVPLDSALDVPVGTQFAVMNYSDKRVLISGVGECQVRGPVHNAVPPWKVGVLVKYNANFWLLSLGSGANGAFATPTAPKLVAAEAGNKSVTLRWEKPEDDGGYPILGYTEQMSVDEVAWTEVGRQGDISTMSATITGLSPGKKFFRVLAFNEVGEGDPSNVLSASPLLPAPILSHPAGGQFKVEGYDPTNTYTVTANDGSKPTINSSGVITGMGGNSIITVTYVFAGTQSSPAYGERRQYEYHDECHDECTPRCGSAYQWVNCDCPGPNCCNGCNNCWGGGVDGSCAADGTICCGGSRGQDCRQVCVKVKNATPSGFTDSGGEWWRVWNG